MAIARFEKITVNNLTFGQSDFGEQSTTQTKWFDTRALVADVANSLGTRVHKWIEDFWSGKAPAIPEDDEVLRERIDKFMEIHDKRLSVLLPLKSELKIFSRVDKIEKWNKIQLKFLEAHKYHTDFAIHNRQPKKEKRIEKQDKTRQQDKRR